MTMIEAVVVVLETTIIAGADVVRAVKGMVVVAGSEEVEVVLQPLQLLQLFLRKWTYTKKSGDENVRLSWLVEGMQLLDDLPVRKQVCWLLPKIDIDGHRVHRHHPCLLLLHRQQGTLRHLRQATKWHPEREALKRLLLWKQRNENC